MFFENFSLYTNQHLKSRLDPFLYIKNAPRRHGKEKWSETEGKDLVVGIPAKRGF